MDQSAAAATRLQAAWRGARTRGALDALLLAAASSAVAATRVQSAWRGRLARDDLLLQQLAATDIQARWRGKLHRDDLLLQQLAATDIQAHWRGRRGRRMAARGCAAPSLTLAGPSGPPARLSPPDGALVLGRGSLGLEHPRLHRKHVRVAWAAARAGGGGWAAQRVGRNPAYVRRAAQEGGETHKVPAAPASLALRDADTLYCSRPDSSIAAPIRVGISVDRAVDRHGEAAVAADLPPPPRAAERAGQDTRLPSATGLDTTALSGDQLALAGAPDDELESPKLVFSVKQQHRLDQPKTVDMRVDADELTIFAGHKAVETLAFSDIASWSVRPGRYLDLVMAGGQPRRFATAETTRIGHLLSNAAAAGRLPAAAPSARAPEPGAPAQKIRPKTPRRRDEQRGRQSRRVSAPRAGGQVFLVTQQHLWRAPRSAELVVDDRALRLVSGGETREVYSIAALLSWSVVQGTTGCELLIDHSRFVASNEGLRFGCTSEVAKQLATALSKLAPTRQLPGAADPLLNDATPEAAPDQPSSRIKVQAVFGVEQGMVKIWPLAPKRLLVGVGDAGLVAFTGGDSSRVVETFGLEQIFSWSVRSARDITLLLAADTGEDVRRLTLRCEQSEQLGSLLARVSRRAERSARRGSSGDGGDVLGRESSMSRSLQTVSRRNLDTAARPSPEGERDPTTPHSNTPSALSPAASSASVAERLARLKAARSAVASARAQTHA